MHTRARVFLTGLTAAIAFAVLVGGASAQRLEMSNTSIRATFPQLQFITGAVSIRCPVTLEGTFHSRTIAKVFNSLIGYITRAITNQSACREEGLSGFTLLQASLPWHIRYDQFEGVLPNIARIYLRFILVSIKVRDPFGIECLYRSEVAGSAKGYFERVFLTGQARNLVMEPAATISKAEGSMLCPGSASFEGTAGLRLLGSATTLIFVRLI